MPISVRANPSGIPKPNFGKSTLQLLSTPTSIIKMKVVHKSDLKAFGTLRREMKVSLTSQGVTVDVSA